MHQQLVNEPVHDCSTLDGRFDVIARITGGGVSGQAGALRLGIARALNEIDAEDNRPALKKAGFLTRDAAGQGAQEVRSQEGPQGTSVLQALIADRGGPMAPLVETTCARPPAATLAGASTARGLRAPRTGGRKQALWVDCSAPTASAASPTAT